jgi:hypothetical protein
MLSTYAPYQASIQRQIDYAQKKLLVVEIPLSLRATTYLRLCCSALRQAHQARLATASGFRSQAPKITYLGLLRQLMQESSDWWNACYVSPAGLLESTNSAIQSLLQPLNTFVQSYCELLLVA